MGYFPWKSKAWDWANLLGIQSATTQNNTIICMCLCVYPHTRYSIETVLQLITAVEYFGAIEFLISFVIYLFSLF